MNLKDFEYFATLAQINHFGQAATEGAISFKHANLKTWKMNSMLNYLRKPRNRSCSLLKVENFSAGFK